MAAAYVRRRVARSVINHDHFILVPGQTLLAQTIQGLIQQARPVQRGNDDADRGGCQRGIHCEAASNGITSTTRKHSSRELCAVFSSTTLRPRSACEQSYRTPRGRMVCATGKTSMMPIFNLRSANRRDHTFS